MIMITFGLMDLAAMALVAVAITTERLAMDERGGARAVGAVTLAAGFVLLARAI
jgi:predicted metal-binding membrane protein